jgi:hypothetical protein
LKQFCAFPFALKYILQIYYKNVKGLSQFFWNWMKSRYSKHFNRAIAR